MGYRGYRGTSHCRLVVVGVVVVVVEIISNFGSGIICRKVVFDRQIMEEVNKMD